MIGGIGPPRTGAPHTDAPHAARQIDLQRQLNAWLMHYRKCMHYYAGQHTIGETLCLENIITLLELEIELFGTLNGLQQGIIPGRTYPSAINGIRRDGLEDGTVFGIANAANG